MILRKLALILAMCLPATLMVQAAATEDLTDWMSIGEDAQGQARWLINTASVDFHTEGPTTYATAVFMEFNSKAKVLAQIKVAQCLAHKTGELRLYFYTKNGRLDKKQGFDYFYDETGGKVYDAMGTNLCEFTQLAAEQAKEREQQASPGEPQEQPNKAPAAPLHKGLDS
eukprot:gnl/Spiro4/25331_TR12619_c0_g1_i1.p1 gnl/Spiro4/25331_TR12619_c0_g1~~gnl/Spiro4/25331_TR12619_c0_g1_i1.p1  ORF type:complete len:170 (+),score=16.90 gnl/Spiro4/25331_TR12619_c0_g1_i1:2970-3479(+)